MQQLALINPENISEQEANNYSIRNAARAVVIDNENKVGLLYVSNIQYYKLPGGGMKVDENPLVALQRECREELGCEIEVINEIGLIVEYRKPSNLKQTSYCYLVKVNGSKSSPNFTEKEIKDGFKTVWLSYGEAIKTIKENKGSDIESHQYTVTRDTRFLEAVRDFFEK